MAWDSILAKDFCKSVRDGTHDTPKQMEMGYKLVTSKCIHDGFIFPEEAYFISEKDYRAINERSLVEQWDALMSMIGNGLGRSAVVKQKPDYAIKNLALLNVGDEYKAKWLHYYLSSPVGQGLIYNSLQGSGQPFISLNLLRNFAIPNPPYEAIKKIVSVLELYDDLIENNQKQIKLLEEAAQRLYKQWFIDLRYPGHETTKIVDGLPEGWKTVQIQDVCKNIGAGGTPSRSQKSFWENGNIDWFKTQELCDCWLFEASEKISEEGLKRSAAKMFPANSILMAIYASPTLGRLGILTKEACSNQAALCLQVDESKVSNYWLYLKLFELRDQFNSIARGAGQQNISGIIVKETEIALPAISVINDFTRLVRPFFEKQRTLQLQNISLTQTCDRLLPKLMNGELV